MPKLLPFPKLLAFLLLMITLSLGDQTPKDISLRFSENIQAKPDSPTYYKLTLPEDWKTESSLSVYAISRGGCFVNLFISKTKETPDSEYASDYSIADESPKAVIFIPGSDLKPSSKLYIGVSSDSECPIEFVVEEPYYVHVTADESSYFTQYNIGPNTLRDKTSIVMTLTVPDDDDSERITMNINALSFMSSELPHLEMFMKKGDVIPDSRNHDQISQTAWFEGITALVYDDNPAFCLGCNYTISLIFEQSALVNFHISILEANIELMPIPVMDGVQKGEINTYLVNRTEDLTEANLVIPINVISGNPLVYINCDNTTNDIAEFKWMYNLTTSQNILLTPREHSICSTGVYVIAVVGQNQDAVYSIRVDLRPSNRLFIQKDVPNIGDIFPGEMVTYDVYLPIYAGEKMVLTLEPKEVDFEIQECRYASDCPDLVPPPQDVWGLFGEILGKIIPDKFEPEITSLENGKKAVIDVHNNGCVPFLMKDIYNPEVPLPVCAYKIKLTSSNPIFPVEYKLLADIEGHTLLLPGIPIEDDVVVDDEEFYMFYAPYPDIKSVEIQLTILSGDVDLFVSNETMYPKEGDDNTRFSHEGLVIYTHSTHLNGTYYISVKGRQTSSYVLAVTIITDNNREQNYAIRLHEGVPQKGVLLPKHEHPALYYSMNIFFDDDWEGEIKVSVTPNHGNLVITVDNDGDIPYPNHADWETNKHELTLPSNTPGFARRREYMIGIYPDPEDSSTLTYDQITFTIVYSIQTTKEEDVTKELEHLIPVNSKHIVLSSNSPFEGKISKGEIRYFKFSAYSTDEGVTATLQSSSNDVSLYAAVGNTNQYPSPKSYLTTTRNTYRNDLSITKAQLQEVCPSNDEDPTVCPIYLAVITTQGDEIRFSLDIRRGINKDDMTRTPLINLPIGKERIFPILPDNEFIYFYFYTTAKVETLITVAARHQDIEIYAAIVEGELGADLNDEVEDPEKLKYDFSSGQNEATFTGYNNLRIPPSDKSSLMVCKVRFRDEGEVVIVSVSPTFSIIVSNQITTISTNKVHYGEAYENEAYNYFSFDVPDPNASFKVSLTSLTDANHDLYLSFGKYARPTYEAHDFFSASSPRLEQLSLSVADVYPRKTMDGTWTIGVYSETKGEYSLLVTIGKQMTRLTESTPLQYYLKEKEEVYFSYYHDREMDLQIKLDKMSGDPTIYIKAYEKGSSVDDYLPGLNNYTWKFSPTHQATNTITADESNYCTHCLYVMKVVTEKASKFTIVVLEKGHWEFAQNGVTLQDNILPGDLKGYYFSAQGEKGANIHVKALNGLINIYTSHNSAANITNYMEKKSLTTTQRYTSWNMTPNDYVMYPQQIQVWDGSRMYASEPNGYYIVLENVDTHPVNYTILFQARDASQINLIPNSKQHLFVESSAEQSFIFYSSSNKENTKISLEYSYPEATNSINEADMKFTANFWAEKVTAGPGQKVSLLKNEVIVDKVIDGIRFMRKNVEVQSQTGKYEFVITNPLKQRVDFSILVYTVQDTDFISLEDNSYHFSRLRLDESETYEIYLSKPGAWYFELNQCSGKFEISIADSLNDVNLEKNLFKPDKDAFFSQLYVKSAGSKYVRVRAFETESSEEGATFLIRNMYFQDKALIDFNQAKPGNITATQELYNPQSRRFPINFEPVSFSGASKGDFGLYKIVACKDQALAHRIAMCEMRPLGSASGENCFFDEFTQNFDTKTTHQSNLQLSPGNYYIYGVGNIIHKGEAVHSVPYTHLVVTLNDENLLKTIVRDYLPIVGAGIALGLLMVVFWVCYRRVKEKRLVTKMNEMQQFRGRGYGVMHEEF